MHDIRLGDVGEWNVAESVNAESKQTRSTKTTQFQPVQRNGGRHMTQREEVTAVDGRRSCYL